MDLLRGMLALSVVLAWNAAAFSQSFGPAAAPGPAGGGGQLAGQLSQLNSAQSAASSAIAQAGTTGAAGAAGIGGVGRTRQFPVLKYLSQKHAVHKAKLRSSPLGKMLKGIMKPLSQITGGVIPAEHPPNHVELAAPGPQGSAAKIKQDQLNAPKRLAAIQELGKVDCHWYPEAQAELVAALRTDRDECVRFEAAKILSQCNCCSDAIIRALRVCVAGTEIDGNPGERSLRIRNQAALGLERCLANGPQNSSNTLPLRPEYPTPPNAFEIAPPPLSNANPDTPSGGVGLASFNSPASVPDPQVEMAQAQSSLDQFRALQETTETKPPGSVYEIWQQSKQKRTP